jgi:hypothetical protein
MKRINPLLTLSLLAALPASLSFAQTSPKAATSPATKSAATVAKSASTTTTTSASSPAAPTTSNSAKRTDVYHVHFTHAAPGKAAALADALKQPAPDAPMPGHAVMFRHQDGDSWDYCVIQHMGTKATVEIAATVPPASAATRDASDWHTDTFCNGPAWADFAKAMGINEGAGKSAVYIVSVYRASPGHREQLEDILGTQPAGDPAAGNVLLQHLEGAAWTYLAVARYATWEDFVKSETSSAADQAKGSSDWAKLREHSSYHTDTLCDRIAP